MTALTLPACADGDSDDSTATATPDPASVSTPTATPTSTVEHTPVPSSTPAPSPTEAEPDFEYELSATMGGPVVPQFPYDVALLGDGRIAVADFGLNQVQIYSRDGSLERSWAAAEPEPQGQAGRYFAHRIAAADDSLYVSFAARSKLTRFNLEGDVLAEHIFEDPEPRVRDLTAGPDGRLYLVIGDRQRETESHSSPYGVLVFDPQLNLVETWDAPNGIAPLALAFDADGVASVLLYDYLANIDDPTDRVQPARIAMLDPENYAPDAWELPLELPVEGQFDGLAVAPDGGHILVEESSEYGNDSDVTAIYIVPAGGDDVTRWELPEQGTVGRTVSPGLALTDDGTMLIADPVNNRLLDVSLEGEILESIEDRRHARFASPDAIAVGPQGNVFAVDAVLGVVHEFTSGGDLVNSLPITARQINPFVNLIDIAIAGNGDIYIGGPTPPQIGSFRKLDSDGRETVIEVDVIQDLESRFIFSPDSAAIGPDGLLYLGMGQFGQVRAYTDEGETADIWPEEGGDIERVYWIASGPDGVLAVTTREIDGQSAIVIVRVDDTEEIVAVFQNDQPDVEPIPDAIDVLPYDFAVASDGSFYLLDSLAQEVVRLNPDGEETGRFDVSSDDVERQFRSIAVDDERRVYLTDATNREILVYSPVE